MMFLDASVIIAILTREEGWEAYATVLGQAHTIYVSPLCRWEAVIGLRRKRTLNLDEASAAVEELFAEVDVKMVEITSGIGKMAEEANDRYGLTRHPAGLNFGDCFAYACAKAHRVPLLYKGNDFSKTDLA